MSSTYSRLRRAPGLRVASALLVVLTQAMSSAWAADAFAEREVSEANRKIRKLRDEALKQENLLARHELLEAAKRAAQEESARFDGKEPATPKAAGELASLLLAADRNRDAIPHFLRFLSAAPDGLPPPMREPPGPKAAKKPAQLTPKELERLMKRAKEIEEWAEGGIIAAELGMALLVAPDESSFRALVEEGKRIFPDGEALMAGLPDITWLSLLKLQETPETRSSVRNLTSDFTKLARKENRAGLKRLLDRLGHKAPDVYVTRTIGDVGPRSTPEFENKVVLLQFCAGITFTTDFRPVRQLLETYGDQGLLAVTVLHCTGTFVDPGRQIQGTHLDQASELAHLQGYHEHYHLRWPFWVDEDLDPANARDRERGARNLRPYVAEAGELSAAPKYVLLDRRGRVRHIHMSERLHDQLELAVKTLLAEPAEEE
ncbi:MAG: hypothetical protein AB1486_10580 [Planctomycetota bacterium]